MALAGIDPGGRGFRDKLSFSQMQRARQAASSIHGTILHKRTGSDIKEDSLEDLGDDSDGELLLDDVEMRLPAVDSKYEKLREVLSRLWEEEPDRKVIVFTTFVGTSRYLSERLRKEGVVTGRIAGREAMKSAALGPGVFTPED